MNCHQRLDHVINCKSSVYNESYSNNLFNNNSVYSYVEDFNFCPWCGLDFVKEETNEEKSS
jgi:hypothetical protein